MDFESSPGMPDRTHILLIYGLYIAGFLVGFTLPIGVILAYVFRRDSVGVGRTHLSSLIRLFWWDMAAIAIFVVLVFGSSLVEWSEFSELGKWLSEVPFLLYSVWNIVLFVLLVNGTLKAYRREAV